MIHTGEFYCIITEEDLSRIRHRYNVNRKGTIKLTDFVKSKGIKNAIIKEFNSILTIYMFVDFTLMMNKGDIQIEDTDLIVSNIRAYVTNILEHRTNGLYLGRIDFKFDAIVENREERKILMLLYEKSLERAAYMEKIKVEKYRGESIRFTSKSRTSNIYDKEQERSNNGEEVQPFEYGIIRYEAQIKNRHLNYQYRNHNLIKDFRIYFTLEKYYSYMEKMIINILRPGDYYSFKEAKKKIQSSRFREKEKEQLIEFLKMVSRRKMTKTKKDINRYRFEKSIKMLEELKINPVTIPQQYNIKFIANPLNVLQERGKEFRNNS